MTTTHRIEGYLRTAAIREQNGLATIIVVLDQRSAYGGSPITAVRSYPRAEAERARRHHSILLQHIGQRMVAKGAALAALAGGIHLLGVRRIQTTATERDSAANDSRANDMPASTAWPSRRMGALGAA